MVNLTDRLKNLEALVSSLASQDLVVQQRQQSDGSSHAPMAVSSQEPGLAPRPSSSEGKKGLKPETPRIRPTQDGHVNYVDSNHWLSVLEDIREVREHLSPDGTVLSEEASRDEGPKWEPDDRPVSSVLGLEANLSLEEILTSLPPRAICDRLLSHYFNSRFQVLGEQDGQPLKTRA
jgi:hypothetical protein